MQGTALSRQERSIGKEILNRRDFPARQKTPPKYDALLNEGIAPPPKNGKAPRPKRGKHSPSYTVSGKGKNNGRPHRLPGKYSRPTGKGSWSPVCPPKRLSRDLDGARVRRELSALLAALVAGQPGANAAGLPGALGGALGGAVDSQLIDKINALCF